MDCAGSIIRGHRLPRVPVTEREIYLAPFEQEQSKKPTLAIVSEQYDFVFLLSPGTGSTAVANALVNAGVGEWCPPEDLRMGPGDDDVVLRKHTTYRQLRDWDVLPRPLTDYQIVTTVRNPFDFWVSEYVRQRDRWSQRLDDPNSHVFRKKGDSDSVELATTLSFSEWMHQRWGDRDEQYAEMLHPEFAFRSDYFLHFERLEETLQDWLESRGVEETVRLERMNVTDRDADYRTYYDDSTRQLLERVHRFYLKRFGYSF